MLHAVMLAAYMLAAPSTPPTISWVRTYNGPGNHNDEAKVLSRDSKGNIYVGGSSYSAATLDDFTLLKYDQSGGLVWERYYGGAFGGTDRPTALEVDSQDNIIIAGVTQFPGSQGIIALKYDADGTLLWSRSRITGSFTDKTPKMAIDASDNVVLAHFLQGQYLTLKYNSAGDFMWERQFDGHDPAHEDFCTDITVDAGGNVIVTGLVNLSSGCTTVKYDADGTLLWDRADAGEIASMLGPAQVRTDSLGNVFVYSEPESACGISHFQLVKYDPDGNVLWTRHNDDQPCEGSEPADIAIDHAGNAVIACSVAVAQGGIRIQTRKYAPNGDLTWSATHIPHQARPTAINLDHAGNVYVTGQSYNGLGIFDFFTLKYDPQGRERWNVVLDVANHSSDEARAVLADGAGGIYVTGRANSDFGTIRYQQPVCFADVVPDAIVNIDDLVAVITGWGLCPGGQAGCTGDVSPLGIGDGIVNIDDLVAVITTWGQCP